MRARDRLDVAPGQRRDAAEVPEEVHGDALGPEQRPRIAGDARDLAARRDAPAVRDDHLDGGRGIERLEGRLHQLHARRSRPACARQ